MNLTSRLFHEAATNCNLNPGKKSQEALDKHSFSVKEMPITSTEPSLEPPDSLNLDINVSHHLITIDESITLETRKKQSSYMRKLVY